LLLNANEHYSCKYISEKDSKASFTTIPWESIPAVKLVDTVTGKPCIEETIVRGCWSEKFLCFQYICQDAYIRSEFTKHDEPLYEQDVIELFIDEEGKGIHYIELEISPHNVIFDAKITNDGQGKIKSTDISWDVDGLISEVQKPQLNMLVYYVYIPAHNFEAPLEKGKVLKGNFYRIDEQKSGEREYQAWRPTGAVNYHLSQAFGNLILE